MSNYPKIKNDNFNRFATDRIDAVWWGSAFLWGALTLLVENSIWATSIDMWDGRGVFFLGIGFLALVCAVIRLQIPKYRSKWSFSAIFGIIFLAIGLSSWETAWWIWVVILASVGILILVSTFTRKA